MRPAVTAAEAWDWDQMRTTCVWVVTVEGMVTVDRPLFRRIFKLFQKDALPFLGREHEAIGRGEFGHQDVRFPRACDESPKSSVGHILHRRLHEKRPRQFIPETHIAPHYHKRRKRARSHTFRKDSEQP